MAWAFLVMYQTHASACTLKFPTNFQGLTGRIAAIDLTIRHGAIASLPSLPVGWQLYIDNDPSWNTRISGHALVGAAFLKLEELPNLIHVVPEPHYSCSKLNKSGLLQLKVQLYEHDQMQDRIVEHLSAED